MPLYFPTHSTHCGTHCPDFRILGHAIGRVVDKLAGSHLKIMRYLVSFKRERERERERERGGDFYLQKDIYRKSPFPNIEKEENERTKNIKQRGRAKENNYIALPYYSQMAFVSRPNQ